VANDQADAGSTVAALAVVGLLAGVIGAGWAYFAWPDGSSHDSRILVVLSLSLTIAGAFALMAAIVAWAVRLGIQWSGLRDHIVHDVLHPATPKDGSYLDEDGR
jgi:hypothetical protein